MSVEVKHSKIALVKVECREDPRDYLEMEPRGDYLRIEASRDDHFEVSVHMTKGDVKALINALTEIEKDMT